MADSIAQAPFAVNVQGGPDQNALNDTQGYAQYGLDMPTAPPARDLSQADPHSETATPGAPVPARKRSSRHMLYSVEILVFSVVGWGWLALREYMGATPVLDVSVLLSLLISSLVNFALSLIYHTTDQFKPAAQAFLAHTLSLLALYLYGLSESSMARSDPLCCNGASTYSVSQTYAAAYFGGLPLHQAAGMVTVAFLSVLLVIAAAQARVCLDDPRLWLTRDVLIAVVCLFSLHLGLFASAAKVCGDGGLGTGVVMAAGFMLVVMLHVPEDAFEAFRLIRGWLNWRDGGVNAQRDARSDKESSLLLGLVQQILELFAVAMLGVMAALLSSKLGGAPSTVLLVAFGFVALCLALVVVASLAELLGAGKPNSMHSQESQQQADSSQEPGAPSAPPKSLLSRYSNGRPVMMLPSVREMRLHGTRRRERKAW